MFNFNPFDTKKRRRARNKKEREAKEAEKQPVLILQSTFLHRDFIAVARVLRHVVHRAREHEVGRADSRGVVPAEADRARVERGVVCWQQRSVRRQRDDRPLLHSHVSM